MADFTWFDTLVLAVIALSALLGLWRGLVSEALALLAWVAAFLAAKLFGNAVAGIIGNLLHDPAVRQIAGFAAVFIATLLLFAIARLLLSTLLRAIGLGMLDRVLGMIFGVARGVLLVLALVMLGGLTDLPRRHDWRDAALAPPLETAVIALKPYLPNALAQKIHYRTTQASGQQRNPVNMVERNSRPQGRWM